MGKSIGIRCNPHQVYYSIIENDTKVTITNADRIVLPKSLIKSEQLKYVRNTMIDILREYEIIYAGIRIYENTSQSFDRDRVYLEGVLIELLASVDLQKYYIGQIANISSMIGIPRDNFKKVVNGEIPFETIVGFDKLGKEHKEATLTSLGALRC